MDSTLDSKDDSKEDLQKRTRQRIAVIPGDGVGQEVIPQALHVIRASGADLDFTAIELILKTDLSLASKLLKHLNSAAFGWRRVMRSCSSA